MLLAIVLPISGCMTAKRQQQEIDLLSAQVQQLTTDVARLASVTEEMTPTVNLLWEFLEEKLSSPIVKVDLITPEK